MPDILINQSPERRILDLRALGFHDVLVLGRYHYSAAHAPLDQHCHGKLLEICYLEQGEQTYVVGDNRYDLAGGDVFLTFPNEPHGTGSAPESRGVLFWVLLRLPSRNRPFLGLSPRQSGQLKQSLLELPRRFWAGQQPAATLYRVFSVHDHQGTPLRILQLQNLLVRFLFDLVDACSRQDRMPSPLVRRVQEAVEGQPDQILRVSDLARIAGLSESQFQQRFKQEVGISPADYVLRRKVEAAKSLLDSGRLSVTQIAMELGFSTSQYFATVFKRYTGRTPTTFRAERVHS